MRRSSRAGVCLLLALLAAGCVRFGSRNVVPDSFNYNEAIAETASDQMLLNLVRMRYQQVPTFLTVGSVLTQYVYNGSLGVQGAAGDGNGFPMSSVGGSGALRYIERPTITFNPLSGQDFAQRLLAPVPSEQLLALIRSGWPADLLLFVGLQDLNGIHNIPFDQTPSRETFGGVMAFRRVVDLLLGLLQRGAIRIERPPAQPHQADSSYLVLQSNGDPETDALLAEFRSSLRLDPRRDRFRVTDHRGPPARDELSMHVRSLLAMMSFLAYGVEVPNDHANRVAPISHPEAAKLLPTLVPLRIRSSDEKPDDAYAAVEYDDYWFYVAYDDHTSKETFSLLSYLFQLQSPATPLSTPLVTVPTG